MTSHNKMLLVALACLISVSSQSRAQDVIFDAESMTDPMAWSDPVNWDGDALPTAADNVRIGDFAVASPVEVNISDPAEDYLIGDLRLGVGVLGEGTLNHSAGNLTTDQFKWSFIGADGASGVSAVGTYNLSGTGAFTADLGEFGMVDSDTEFHIGIGSDGSGQPGENMGTLNLCQTPTEGDCSASFTVNRMYVGSNDGNTGVINQGGGSLYVDDWLAIGREGEATGSYNMTGGSLVVANNGLTVGESGGSSAEMHLSNDATVNSAIIQVGRSLFNAPEDDTVTGLLTITGDEVNVEAGFFSMGYTVDFDEGSQSFVGVETEGEGTLRFTSASSVSPIVVLEDAYLNDGSTAGFAKLEVDLETNPAPAGNILLVDVGGTLTGEFMGLPEGAAVPNSGGRTITYTGGDGNDIYLIDPNAISGDFDGNGLYECADVDALVAEIVAGTNNSTFDLTGDTLVNDLDLDAWRAEAGSVGGLTASGNPVQEGDATLDGLVDGGDFLVWNTNKFTDAPGWCAGDFNADGTVDGADFLLWNTNKFTTADGVSAVPEPAALLLVLGSLFTWGRFRR